jgi:FkbM family methyltransferase
MLIGDFMPLDGLKQVCIAAGLYRPARVLHRTLLPSKRRAFRADKAFYSQFIRPGDLCFDIGANVGAKTEAMLALGGRVVSVEPQPKLAAEVAARCSLYGQKHAVVSKAVGHQPGTLTLHLRASSGQASFFSDWEGIPAGNMIVEVTTLDELIAQFGAPHFCKIDVEGYEPQVLRGLSKRIPVVSFEYHSDERWAAVARECIQILSAFGEIKINATGAEGGTLLFPEWVGPNEFLSSFPSSILPHPFGDLIVAT